MLLPSKPNRRLQYSTVQYSSISPFPTPEHITSPKKLSPLRPPELPKDNPFRSRDWICSSYDFKYSASVSTELQLQILNSSESARKFDIRAGREAGAELSFSWMSPCGNCEMGISDVQPSHPCDGSFPRKILRSSIIASGFLQSPLFLLPASDVPLARSHLSSSAMPT